MANTTAEARISLVFDSNAKIVRSEVEQLAASLEKLSKEALKNASSSQGSDLGQQYREGAQAAAQLGMALKNAMNVDTKKLDLGQFINQVEKGHMDLEQLLTSMRALGPAGQEAFVKVSNQIATAEIPLKRTGVLMEKLAKSFANVVTWKISSGVLMGFTRSVQQAASYAQSLDKSLNNIRIVTSLSTDEMAKFATKANEAAKSLSTTTTAYTNAALIYYQQGIRDESEIAARTEATVKMANVTRETSSQISQDLTAIWNNFYDGSKSLEYYADVLTALGATTASSTSEIATGLEKFASIARTVGLSYEYASAALATVTAQTRQSADIVGTAFKTLFARIEQLKLGDTLEDGVSLGKYSEALQKVGVSVLDTTGNLRDMDGILDDLGDRWGDLSRAQQVALAQTVAGMRQYSQFIALMDNWDKMQTNIVTAKSSTGTLQEQADIYAESWEGARKRVKASLEDIYDTLINSQFFIKFNNLLASVLDTVHNIIKGLGGLPGLLLAIGTIASRSLQGPLAGFYERTFSNMALATGVTNVKNDLVKGAIIQANTNAGNDTKSGMLTNQTLELSGRLRDVSDKITEAQKLQIEALIKQNGEYSIQVSNLEEELRLLKEIEAEKAKDINRPIEELQGVQKKINSNNEKDFTSDEKKRGVLFAAGWGQSSSDSAKEHNNTNWKTIYENRALFKADAQKEIEAANPHLIEAESIIGKIGGNTSSIKRWKEELEKEGITDAEIQELKQKIAQKEKEIKELTEQLESLKQAYWKFWDKYSNIDTATSNINANGSEYKQQKKNYLNDSETKRKFYSRRLSKGDKTYLKARQQTEEKEGEIESTYKEGKENAQYLSDMLDNIDADPLQDLGLIAAQATSSLTSVGMAISSIISVNKVLADESMGPWQKFATLLTTVGFALSSLHRTYSSLAAIKALINKLTSEENIINIAAALIGKEKLAVEAANLDITEITNKEELKQVVLETLHIKTMDGEAKKLVLLNSLKEAGVVATLGYAAAIAALVFIIIQVYEAYHQEQRALENVQKAYDDLNKTYEDNRNQLESLTSAVNAYEDALEHLNNTVKGTTAWNEALDNVNNTVASIIEKYPHLIKYMTIANNNGQLSITGLDKALEAQENQTRLSQMALYNTGKKLAQQKVAAERERVRNSDIFKGNELYQFTDEQLDTLAKLVKDEKNYVKGADASAYYLSVTGFTTSLDTCEQALLSLANTTENSSKEINNYNALIESLLSQQGYSKDQIEQIQDNSSQERYNQLYQEALGQFSGEYSGITRVDNAGSVKVQELFDRFAEATGINIGLTSGNSILGGWGNRAYVDTTGKEWKATDLAAIMATAQLAQEAAEGMTPAESGTITSPSSKRFSVDNTSANAQSRVLSDVLNKQLSVGDTISEENMAKLKNAGINMEQFFTQMSDGTYALTQDAELFNSTVEHLLSGQYIKNAQNFENAYGKTTSAFQSGDYASSVQGLLDLEGFNTDNLPAETWANIQTKIAEGVTEFDVNEILVIKQALEELNKQMSETERFAFMQATSLDELHHVANQLGDYYETNYANALINIASQYDNCTAEIEEYQRALDNGSESTIKITEENLELAVTIGEAAKAFDLNAEEIEVQTEKLAQEAKNAKLSKQELAQLAIANQRLNRGVEELNSNWEDWNKELTTGNKASKTYASTIVKLRKAVADLTNEIDETNITTEFLEEHLEDIGKAANGDAKSIDKINGALAKLKVDKLRNLAINNIDFTGNDNFDTKQFDRIASIFDTVNNGIDSIQSHWDDLLNGMDIADVLNVDDWVAALNQMALATGMSAAEMHSLLSEIGVQADVEVVQQATQVHVPRYRTETKVIDSDPTLPNGWSAVETKTWQVGTDIEEGVIDVAQINTDGSNSKPSIHFAPASRQSSGGVSKGGSGGGGGGGSKKKLKKESELERYHYIKETIEDLEEAYSKANKEKDRLFGGDRVRAIDKEIAATQDLIDEQDVYLKAIEKYRDETDIPNLKARVLEYTGLTADTDEVGRIINYDEIMRKAIDKFNADLSENADEKYEEFMHFIKQYEDTINLYEEQTSKKEDLLRQKQDLNFEKLNYVVELRVKVNERELQTIENSINLLGDSVYKASERLDLLWSSSGEVTDKFDNLNSAINIQIGQLGQLDKALAAGDISQDQYMEGLEGVRDALQENLDTLIAYDDEMRTYYSTTLKSASEEMDFWTKQLEHSTDVLEHYQKVVSLSGNAKNYNMMSALLKGQVLTRQNTYDSSKQWYDTLVQQRASIEQQMAEAQQRVRDASNEKEHKAAVREVEWLRDKYNAIIEETNQAQETMLSNLESYLEAINADLENDLEKISYQYEQLMSNGLGFDYINSDLDKLKTIQDEYLTKTNQVYETTKFLRQIQSDMDKTDNIAQKAKLQNFSKMVEGLKEQGQLSKVELEIAKRRYEIELAQMALEDARNAKSIVRLSRDNEGNYGYVYSADPDKANDAEQDLMDKQNDLYNYVLETYNTNKTKLTELWNQQQQEILDLEEYYHKNGLELDETYQKKKEEILKRYEDEAFIYIQNTNEARNVLNEVALTDYTEAYASHYDDIIYTVEDWKDKSNAYIDEVHDRYTDWKNLVKTEVEPVVGNSLRQLTKKTNEVTTASDSLHNKITTEVIPALSNEVSAVDETTAAYERKRDMIWEVVEALQAEMGGIDQKFAAGAADASEAAGYFDKSVDYGRLTAAYLAYGGNFNDSVYRQLMAQTDAKIDWYKAQGIGREYWGYTSSERTANWHGKTTEQLLSDAGGMTKAQMQDLLKKLGLSASFSTGGYTGEWESDEGRIAFLHQKEMVLNEDDTSNMLKIIQFVRDIANMIDLQAVSTAAGLGYISTPTIGSTSSELDQNVHIEANFPNVTDHNEIEQALTTLVNRAAQFANRK